MEEVEIATMEAMMNASEDKYFNARPALRTIDNCRLFRAAYERAYKDAGNLFGANSKPKQAEPN